jgi:hypothetical protein
VRFHDLQIHFIPYINAIDSTCNSYEIVWMNDDYTHLGTYLTYIPSMRIREKLSDSQFESVFTHRKCFNIFPNEVTIAWLAYVNTKSPSSP